MGEQPCMWWVSGRLFCAFYFYSSGAQPDAAADLGEVEALVNGKGGVEDEEDDHDRVDEGGRVELGDCVVGGRVSWAVVYFLYFIILCFSLCPWPAGAPTHLRRRSSRR